MTFTRFFNKLAIIISIIIVIVWLINLALSKLEDERIERKEREKNLNNGTCVFDKVDLDNFLIANWDKTFKPILNVNDFKKYFNDYLLNVSFNDTSLDLKTIRIDNNDFTFYQIGQNIMVNSINLDKTSQFTFSIKDELNFSPDHKLDSFKEQFPKSYSCRENVSSSSKIEEFALRLDNSNYSSQFQFVILYFNRADNLCFIEFYYQN